MYGLIEPHGGKVRKPLLVARPEGHIRMDSSSSKGAQQTGVPGCRYGGEHRAPELQKEAVYGLTELHREEVRKARLVANPGCYPTCVQLPLCPLLEVSASSRHTLSG